MSASHIAEPAFVATHHPHPISPPAPALDSMQPPGPPALRLRTPGYAHHGLAWSPYFEDRLAVASGANFGLVGNGRVHVLRLGPNGGLLVEKA